MRKTKESVLRGLAVDMKEAYRIESSLSSEVFSSEDAVEGPEGVRREAPAGVEEPLGGRVADTFEDSFAGDRVLITGGSSGIGAGLAEAFAAAGATVGIAARRQDRLAEVVERCRAHTPGSTMWAVDLADPTPSTGWPPGPSTNSAGWTSWSTTPASPSGVTCHGSTPTRWSR